MGDALYYGLNGFGITWTYLFVHIVLATVGLVGIVFNCITLWALRGKDTGLDVSIIFIRNLACSDIINDVMCIYLVCYQLIHYKNYYECAFRMGVLSGMNFNSSQQLLALTLDRYVKIIHPYKYVSIFKEHTAKVYCVWAWSISATLCLLPVIGIRRPPSHGIDYCSFFGVMADSYLITIISCFVFVFLVLVFAYYRILSASWKQIKKCGRQQGMKQLWWKPTKTVLILIVFYCICWIPLGNYLYAPRVDSHRMLLYLVDT